MKKATIILSILIIINFFFSKNFAQADSTDIIDPDLQSGFPVQVYTTSGMYQSGPVIHNLIANLDFDPELEIVSTALASGPLFAWNADSSIMSGFPTIDDSGVAYPAAGNLINASNTLEVFAEYTSANLNAYDSTGKSIPGWPQSFWGSGWMPPSLADVDGDGFDEIFCDSNNRELLGYKANGNSLAGWPVPGGISQEFHTPAIADIDGDGDFEIISASGYVNPGGVSLFAFHHTGDLVSGFPVSFDGLTDTFPVVGDIDGDNALEIIVVGCCPKILVFSGDGVLERSIQIIGGIAYSAAPVLADLDGDNTPEIIVQTETYLNVVRGNGAIFPGWPKFLGDGYWTGNSAPVVGDVDGDQLPDIVISHHIGGQGVTGEILIFGRDGTQNIHSPKSLNIGPGSTPAIADIDLDGRNEIIVSGSYWDGSNGFFDKLWVFDIGGQNHGKIEWGQFGGGPQHRGIYPVPKIEYSPLLPAYRNNVHLPIVSQHVAYQPTLNLHGQVIYNGNGVANIPLELRFYNGVEWSTIQNTTTNKNGNFNFIGVLGLDTDQTYQVRYQNIDQIQGYLSLLVSRKVYNYKEGSNVGISNFDISDLKLISPINGANETLPTTFEWIPRITSPADMFLYVLYDPIDGDPAVQQLIHRGSTGLILYGLPNGFNFNKIYAWSIWPLSPDGAISVPGDTRLITFLDSERKLELFNTKKLLPLNWNIYPNLPCKQFSFLPFCEITP